MAFRNEIEGIALHYPANWTRGSYNYLSSILTIYGPLNNLTDFYFDNIRINVDVKNGTLVDVTAANMIEEYEEAFNNTLNNFKTFNETRINNFW
jgi:hypothetical protein